MKKYSLMMIDLTIDSARVGDHPSTWNYVVSNPELSTKRDVYNQLAQLSKAYGAPVDSVGTVRRHQDPKTGKSFMFAIVEDRSKEVFAYSEKDREKYSA